ncbi:TIGR02281 family clan AA aspartic protease [Nitratireductor aquimarinus]|uniref:TIGR02281 family clan AA aspartic protease n=1 Tax=Alphaproteobacteria TaxID=28211 RepID=UPI0019D34D23|nr:MULTISPECIES: TIGR02281 family clan AA aspartic protease [Alphaproteobacteria]MBY6024386.1 TIGR02281 family clan AA aspartic protease [Nitratireductor sp. DP7N14-4]MBN7759120.1 TIGR02281 family clan AA aspartic protease [Nitratireductor aquimarinus]MBN7761367.1 TIGR02281 family clan AA aspartic protease [Nitratireductor aquibiodomus]MBN7778550.1 TIGR02281 family clan AA aspartic protease [Nitratireductor pacificus]MBN7782872.1 TIGR02281 family clan AA aspartic protease [Nitratireductor paci
MVRKVVMLGIVIGAAGAIPALYQSNPDFYRSLLGSALEETPVEEVQQVAMVRAPAPERGKTSVLLGKRVSIAADRSGHFVGRFKLNGRHTKAMIDTGATYVAINRSTARRIGLNLTASDFKYEVSTANGKASAAAAVIENLQIGRIYIENVEALVLEDRALDSVLIGMSFLERLARYRVEDRALILEQ